MLPHRHGARVVRCGAVALLIAGAVAYPVNRWLLSRGKGHAVVHQYHSH